MLSNPIKVQQMSRFLLDLKFNVFGQPPRGWKQTCTSSAKLSIAWIHFSLGISLILAVIVVFSSTIFWKLLWYTLSLRYTTDKNQGNQNVALYLHALTWFLCSQTVIVTSIDPSLKRKQKLNQLRDLFGSKSRRIPSRVDYILLGMHRLRNKALQKCTSKGLGAFQSLPRFLPVIAEMVDALVLLGPRRLM